MTAFHGELFEALLLRRGTPATGSRNSVDFETSRQQELAGISDRGVQSPQSEVTAGPSSFRMPNDRLQFDRELGAGTVR